jgi:DNA polymerase III epsilon subunit-like protein
LPAETYKIQLEPIKNVEADKATKELAYRLATVNNAIVALSKTLDKSISAQKNAQQTGGADPKIVRTGVIVADKMDKAAELIGKTTKELNKSFKDLPKVIKDAMTVAAGTVKTKVGPTATASLPQSDPEIKTLIRELVQLRRNISKSATYQTGKDDVVKAVDKLIKELSAQKRDITKLTESVRGLARSAGTKEAPKIGEVAKSAYKPTTDAKLFGKALKDMGGEFEKIKRELGDKIVVAVDLETSAFDDTLAKKLGKVAATEFITQIAYQKGTLSEIMSGKAKKEEIYVKPPKGIKTDKEYLERLTKAAPTKDIAKKIEKGAIAFDKLTEEGQEATKAMSLVADVLKDAEAIIGHNIAKFDISVLEQHLEKSGIKVDSAIDKFVDTIKLARHNFPERYGKNFEFGKLQPQSLERLDKDFRLAGIEARSLAESMHDGATDLKVNVALLRALDKSTEELAAVQSNASIMLKKLLENLAMSTKDAAKKFEETSQKVSASSDIIDAVSSNVKKASKILVKQAVEVENLAKVKSALQTRVFKETVIRPKSEAGQQYGIEGPASGEVGDKILRIWGDLAKSLFDLQKYMVHSLETCM